MIIGISGKIGSGKDTVGKIIQYLIANNIEDIKQNEGTFHPSSEEDFTAFLKCDGYSHSGWKIVKFADALKDIVCILTGCTREQLENIEFKNSVLPDEWNKWIIEYDNKTTSRNHYTSIKEAKEYLQRNKNRELHGTIVSIKYTYRDILQIIGTNLFRRLIHDNTWVNILMSKYIPEYKFNDGTKASIKNWHNTKLPNWIITDVRFPNEVKAIKDRGGITIRVERDSTVYHKYTDKDVIEKLSSFGYKLTDIDFSEIAINEGFKYSKSLNLWSFDEEVIPEHTSEQALNNAKFNYTIDNKDTIEELIVKVKEILIKMKLL